MLQQCLQIERSPLYDQDWKTYHYHRNTCGSISRFAVIICLFCGKIQHLQLFFFVPCIFRNYKRLGECDRDRRRKNYNVSAADSVEKLTDYLKDKGIERDPENDMGGRIGFIENGEKIQFASRINGYYGLFTRV